ncbi:MAG TPA: NAD(P)-binding domain-containing protein [Candidatus Limnocylindrales bacterium]|nr:NAD(P)-binding domain-containing protein [Candidatus Limnocylindrales bacterium]
MKVAVIGTGNVGRALGASFSRAGHDVTYAARDAAKTREVADELGASAAVTAADAVDTADVVVLAVPYAALGSLAGEIRDGVAGKVVIDVTNPIKADYSGPALATGSGAEQVATLLPDARVAKAFNTLFASIQADPETLDTPLDGLYATDDDATRATLAELISSIGLRPVHVGALSAARELEALAWLNIRLQMVTGGDWRSSFVLVGAPVAAIAEPAGAAA